MTVPGHVSYSRVVLDVGAHDGAASLPLARGDPSTLVVAFEPSPALANRLKSEAASLSNYVVVHAAVDVDEGTATFNVAPLGTGSLRTMTDENARDGWLQGVEITERVDVQVVRLDRTLNALGITRVNYLHCDAQGNDLNVLRSLGDMLPRVHSGVIEIPARTQLYVDGHSRTEAVEFLIQHGFRPTRVVASDVGRNEQNLYFKCARYRGLGSRNLYRILFRLLSASSGLWILPTRFRVALGIRTRLRRLSTR